MAKTTHPVSFPASESEVTETALMETARGRWFLAEFARRNRTADTELLLDAIARLEASCTESEVPPELDRIRMELMEMSETIARTRQEIASVRADDSAVAPVLAAIEVFDTMVSAGERTSSDILSAAEQVQETAWRLRQTGVDTSICDELDALSCGIHATSASHDITRQRMEKAVGALRYMGARVNTMINVWGLDDLEVIQEDEDAGGADVEVPVGGADVEVPVGGADIDAPVGGADWDEPLVDTPGDASAQSDQAHAHSAEFDVGFASEQEPVDVEAVPRVSLSDLEAEDADFPESDILSVDTSIFEDDVCPPAIADEQSLSVESEVAEAPPHALADEQPASATGLLDDDNDLFESGEPAAPTAQAVGEEAPAFENMDVHLEDPAQEPAEELAEEPDPVEEPDPFETHQAAEAPVAENGSAQEAAEADLPRPQALSAAEHIERLTPNERLALFS